MAIAATVPAVVAGGVMVLANLVLRPSGLRGLGLGRVRRGLFTGLVGGVIVVPVIFFVAQVTELVWRAMRYTHPKEHDLLRFMGDSENLGLTVVLIGSAVLVAPLFEELLFRGHLQTLVTHALARLSGRAAERVPLGRYEVVVPTGGAGAVPALEPAPVTAPPAAARWASVLLTSLIFAAVHPAWTIPPIFVLSVCLGYAYERTGNLWTVMTMHALFNTTSTVLYLVVLR
jgi:membrane protease YdiL (CAAX protease family)